MIFGDIGYDWLIDPEGNLYEGRLTSSRGIIDETYNVLSAHISMGNKSTMGICLLSEDGDFSINEITEEQETALVRFLAWKFQQQHIRDPRRTTILHGVPDQFRIEGHRNWKYTDKYCPGDGVMEKIESIRNKVYYLLLQECFEDSDGDGLPDVIDNCPLDYNPDQADWNENGIGDACEDSDDDGIVDLYDDCFSSILSEADLDQDSVAFDCDNCPLDYNPDQADFDGDGIGDICDDDIDGDGIPNDVDNCEQYYNPGQEDSDNDGIGDVCVELPCDDSEAQAQIQQIQSCLDHIYSAFISDKDDILAVREACIQRVISSIEGDDQDQERVRNDIKFMKSWRKVGIFRLDCLSEYGFVIPLTPDQTDTISNCAYNKVWVDLIQSGWDSTLYSADPDDWHYYLVGKCYCITDQFAELGNLYIASGRSALRCLTATGATCEDIKSPAVYSREYWLHMIAQGYSYLRKSARVDCQNQPYGYLF